MTVKQSCSEAVPQAKDSIVYGWGINDADYNVSSSKNGERNFCPFYITWRTMLSRALSPKTQCRKPTYAGVEVDSRWQRFSNFRKWMAAQDWAGKELDKDIIKPGNKIYGPEYCCFIPKSLNLLLSPGKKTVNKHLPMGAIYLPKKNRYIARCRDGDGNRVHIGTYRTAEEASRAYLKFKADLIKKIAYQQSDKRIAEGLLRHAERLLGEQ